MLVNHLWKCLVKLLECTMIGLHIFTFDHPVIPRSASLWQGCIHWKRMGVVNNWLMVSYCSMFNHIGDDDSQQHQQLVFLYSFMFLWHIPGCYCTRLERHPGVVFHNSPEVLAASAWADPAVANGWAVTGLSSLCTREVFRFPKLRRYHRCCQGRRFSEKEKTNWLLGSGGWVGGGGVDDLHESWFSTGIHLAVQNNCQEHELNVNPGVI